MKGMQNLPIVMRETPRGKPQGIPARFLEKARFVLAKLHACAN